MSDVILKEFTLKLLPPTAKAKALDQISKLALEPVEEKDIYVGRARIANDLYDRSLERFPPAVLEVFARTLVGKPVLVGHDKNMPAVGGWFAASLEKDGSDTHLVGDFYLDAQAEITRRVKLGIAKAISIGATGVSRVCDLCGKSYLSGDCSHQVGQAYDGVTCRLSFVASDRAEALEASLVGLGCQYGAQTVASKSLMPGAGLSIDSFQRPSYDLAGVAALLGKHWGDSMDPKELEERLKALEAEKDALKQENADLKQKAALAEAGAAYFKDLKAELARKAGILKEDPSLIAKLADAADLTTLKALDTQYGERVNALLGGQPLSKQLGEGGVPAPKDDQQQQRTVPDNPFFALRRGD
jgi:hypothetical protein